MVELIWDNKQEMLSETNSETFYQTDKKLIPCIEESKNFDNTDNLYIEGDNLDALKLLKKDYENKIKMIYIDPPYNTEKKFMYNDTFRNKKKKECRHSGWLNMIYPRLKLARDLLTDDGVICIQIDDNEQENLHKLCNEIFGEINHLTTLCIKMSHLSGMKMAHKDKKVPKIKEFILLYAKNVSNIIIKPVYIKGKWENVFDRYSGYIEKPSPNVETWYKVNLSDKIKSLNLSDEQTEKFKLQNAHLIFRTAVNDSVKQYPKDNKFYDIITPTGLKKLVYNSEEVLFAQNKLIQFEDGLFPAESIGDIWTDIGINNLHKEGEINFPNGKKPLKLISRLLQMFTLKFDYILDFFSGSATTAHAVMQLNAEDGGNRKFIMVQLPEETDEKSEAFKAGYKNICEIGKERIRRASKKIHEDRPGTVFDDGFKVYKIK